MNIEVLQDIDSATFSSFKKKEYPEVDKEHYGLPLPDFTEHKYTLVAKENNQIVGYITISVELGVAYIISLLVAKKYQRQGIATKLIRQAEQKAKELGAHKIWLNTGVHWDAKHLYTRLGYIQRCTLPNFYGHQDFILLDKAL